MTEVRITDDLDALLAVLPPHVEAAIRRIDGKDDLIEVVLDLGRVPEARYFDREAILDEREVTEADLEQKVVAIKPVKSKVGPTFKTKGKEVLDMLAAIDPQEAAAALDKGALELVLSDGSKVELDPSFVEVQKKLMIEGKAVETLQVRDILIAVSP